MLSKLSIAAVVALLAIAAPGTADDWSQWRGPQRTGVSAETGLADEWPQAGPKLLWQSKQLGDGYGSAAVVGDRVLVIGNEGLDDEFVQAMDVASGRPIWRRRLGKVGNPDQAPNYSAAKSTPTVDGQFVYALGSDGDLACVTLATGEVRWQKNLREAFGGTPGVWGYSESPLVDGNVLVCSPGGANATIVALNKTTGEMIWKCALEEGYPAGYASPVAASIVGKKQYVQYLAMGMVGVDADTGRFLWRAHETERDTANWTTPIVQKDMVYASAGGIGGAIELAPQGDSLEPKKVYRMRGLPNWIGGAVLIDGHLYGTTDEDLVCADFKTGQIKWKNAAVGVGSLCSADGLLFVHGENGDIALVEVSPTEYREKGRFSLPDKPERRDQMEKAWAYPVVANGRLYIRDKDTLWCYEVAEAPTSKK